MNPNDQNQAQQPGDAPQPATPYGQPAQPQYQQPSPQLQPFQPAGEQTFAPQPIQQPQFAQPQVAPAAHDPALEPQPAGSNAEPTVLSYLLKSLLSPVSTFRQSITDTTPTRFSIVTALVVVVGGVIINLLAIMFSAMRTVESSLFSFLSSEAPKVTWSAEPLKDLPYGSLILMLLLGFGVIVFALAGAYYGASRLMNKRAKSVSFWRIVLILVTAYAPLMLVVAPLVTVLSMFSTSLTMYLAFGLSIVASSMMFAALVTLLNVELSDAPSDTAYRIHVISISTVTIICTFLVIQSMGGFNTVNTARSLSSGKVSPSTSRPSTW